MKIKAEELAGVDGLIVLRPWIKRQTLEQVKDDLVVIGRSGAGYDKIDVAACTMLPMCGRQAIQQMWEMFIGMGGKDLTLETVEV